MIFITNYLKKKKAKQEEEQRQLLINNVKKLEDNIKTAYRKLFMSITETSEEFLFKSIGSRYFIELENGVSYSIDRIDEKVLQFKVNTKYNNFKAFTIKLELLQFNHKIWSHDSTFVRVSGKTWEEYYADLEDFNKIVDKLNIEFLNHIDLVRKASF